jgi:hypothetical protein
LVLELALAAGAQSMSLEQTGLQAKEQGKAKAKERSPKGGGVLSPLVMAGPGNNPVQGFAT